MATYGITATGFYAKPLQTIEDEVDAGIRGILGDDAATDADGKIPLESMAGQLKTLIVDMDSARWDLLQAIYASKDPNSAGGEQQDVVCSITGTIRNAARASVATGTCVGDPGTSLTVGRAATVSGTASRFSTPTGVAIATGTPWYASSGYSLGNLVYNASRTYQCITAGVAAGSQGPSGTSSDITDNTAHWKWVGNGIGYVHVPFVADQAGAIGVATGSLSEIATPVNGWNSVFNLRAGVAGQLKESDSALRYRRDQGLAAPGNTTVDAIRANILKVNEGSTDPSHVPPTSCIVFFNDTDFTDSNGVPPHSIEVLVQDGTEADIAQAIWDSVGGGTRTYGTRSDTVYDSEGNAQTVYWTRPTEVNIYVGAVGRYDATQWPASSDTIVAQTMLSALLTYTADWPIAKDVRTSPLNAAFMRGPAGTTGGLAIVPADPNSSPVHGLLEVDPLYIGISGASGTSQITISRREIAVFDSSRCTVTASSEDP